MKKVPLSRVFVNDEVREAGIRAMNSGWYILANECEAFEAELAAYVGTKEAVLCSSWTTGALMLHHAMGVCPGDEILVPSHTAFPSIEPMIHRGARPVFIDIDETYCIDVDLLEASMTARTVGILPVHLYGHPANLDGIFLAAKKHGLWVIEDCAQAFGAQYRGQRVGSIAVAGAFSFFPSKNLTVMGDGGCITTNDTALAGKLRMLRDHGRSSKYVHDFVGYNFRFNELQAAIGRVELHNIDKLNEHRRDVAARYNDRLEGVVGPTCLSHVCHQHPAARCAGGIFERQRRRHRNSLSSAEPSTAGDHETLFRLAAIGENRSSRERNSFASDLWRFANGRRRLCL